LLNRSDEPVYRVIATLVFVQGVGPERGEEVWREDERVFLSVLPPGRWRAGLMEGWGGSSRRPGVELAFTDHTNRYWIRRVTGVLDEVDKDPVAHYGLALPLDWDMPTPDEA
jgi:hypothetical protein